MIAVALVVLFFLSCAGVGFSLVDRLDPLGRMTRYEQFILATNMGVLVAMFAIWAVGSVTLTSASMGCLLIGLAAVALLVVRRSLAAGMPHGWRLLPYDGRLEWTTALVVCLCALLAAGAIIGSFAPPADADTLRYHFSLAKRDAELGRIAAIFGWSMYDYFPPLGEMLFRFAFVLGGASAAHLIATGFTFLNAAAIAALCRRAGLSLSTTWVGVLLYLSLRTTTDQAGSGNVDHILASFVTAALLAFVIWRSTALPGAMVCFGVLIGAALNVKYHGLVVGACVGLFVFIDALIRRTAVQPVVMAGVIAGGLFLPLVLRNFFDTGNPLFPLLNHVFRPDGIDFFAGVTDTWRPQGLVEILLMPVAIFLQPGRFDGQQFGVPFLLMLAPFAPWSNARRPILALLASIFAAYFVVWYLVTSLDVRYLVPLIAALVVLAAAGGAAVWRWTAQQPVLRYGLLAVLLAGGVGQTTFYAATLIRRLPPALDSARAVSYLELPFFAGFAHYRACEFVTRSLRPGEAYLSVQRAPSFYCPMAPLLMQFGPDERPYLYTNQQPAPLSSRDIADRLEQANVRFVIASVPYPLGRPRSIAVEALIRDFARLYTDAVIDTLPTLSPVFETAHSAVFDGRDVVARLRAAP